MLYLLVLVLISAFASDFGFAAVTNVTFDDQDSGSDVAIVYSPPNAWTQGADCDFCAARANASFAHNGTWHDASYVPGDAQELRMEVSFNGTAIYTYFIVPDLNSDFTQLSFTLDGVDTGNYQHPLMNTSQFIYNIPTFGKDGLSDANHNLIITSGGGNLRTLVLFDYLVYTTGEGGPSLNTVQKHHVNVGEIVGPVIGGVAAVMIIIALAFHLRRRTRNRARSADAARDAWQERIGTLDPYMVQAGDPFGRLGEKGYGNVADQITSGSGTEPQSVSPVSPQSGDPQRGRRLDASPRGDNIARNNGPMSLLSSQQWAPPPSANSDQLPRYETLVTEGRAS